MPLIAGIGVRAYGSGIFSGMMFVGEFAALGTAILWAFSSLLFTIGGHRVGADVVNLNRLIFGLLFIAVTHFAITGMVFPLDVEPWRHGVLFLSAVIGLVIGDAALFYAFVMIGPRLSMLIMTLVPVFSALFAQYCFAEYMNLPQWAAVVFTVGAIAYVVQDDRIKSKGKLKDNFYLIGVVLAIIGALGQTGNLIITKYALVDNFSELSATEIRILFSTVIIGIWMIGRGKTREVVRSFKDRKATLAIAGGALVGPFIGIWLSYIAINNTFVAIASVIMSTVPLLLIPLSAIFLGEKISVRSVTGTIAAFAGIAFLLLQ